MGNDNAGDAGKDNSGADPANPQHKTFSIHIDKQLFRVEQDMLTGSQLRALPTPPIGPELDLFLVVPGGLDRLVGDTETFALKDGMHFISVPRDVTPGA